MLRLNDRSFTDHKITDNKIEFIVNTIVRYIEKAKMGSESMLYL